MKRVILEVGALFFVDLDCKVKCCYGRVSMRKVEGAKQVYYLGRISTLSLVAWEYVAIV